MRTIKLLLVAICVGLFSVVVVRQQTHGRVSIRQSDPGFSTIVTSRYRIDPQQSSFMVRTFSGGLLWFKGHDHFIKIRDFSGEAELTPNAINPASLQMMIRAESLEETRDVFTPEQKKIINREIKELVLETAKYPEITFNSTEVVVNLSSSGQFTAKIGGNLTLHGVTRREMITAVVTLEGNNLRARGEFEINRSDYEVKATSALHGTIRVRNKLHFTFDILAQRVS